MRYCDHGSGYCVTTGTCDDLNACTRDSCDETSTCQHENTCQPIYVGCYTGTCDPATGCHYTPIECSDGDACNGWEYCELDVGCQPGTPPNCGDNPCYRHWCEPASGCHSEYMCGDGNVCNGIEDCDPVAGCLPGIPLECTHTFCMDPHCDPHDGCYFTPNSGRACDDHDACTTGDHCVNGSCEGGPPLPCPDDGNVCNGREYCDWRRGCTTIPYRDCDDDDPCTDDRCDPVDGCQNGCFESFGDGPELPDPDDRTFVNSNGAVLHSGTNVLDIYVTRYAGPTTISGTLVHAVDLVSAGLAVLDTELRIVAFGVEPGKHHAVFFNGLPGYGLRLGDLQPAGCDWSITTFKVPFNSVRFPVSRGSGGGGPPGQPNTVTISVDGSPACLKIKGMYLSIKVMSPIILIHGNESNGGFFVRQEFVLGLDEKHLLWDNSTLLPGALREASAQDLRAFVPGIVRSFGVDSVHLVAHSKGGLDAREYLQRYQPSQVPPFTVLSFTTLSTPHNGSILADIQIARIKAADRAAEIEYPGLPDWPVKVRILTPEKPGWASLTTQACDNFNRENVDALPQEPIYNSVAADADRNYDLELDRAEIGGMHSEDLLLNLLSVPFLDDNAVTALYRTQRYITSVNLHYENRMDPNGFRKLVAVIEGRRLGTQYGSDPMVTTRSGLGTGGWSRRTRNNALLTGGEGRNHATVGDAGVGVLVAQWVIAAERENGDLR